MKFLNEFRRYTAFTLAEVLIVLGVIGIIAEMTLPDLSKSIQENVLKSQVKEIYSALSQATLTLASQDLIDTTNPTTLRDSYSNALAYYNSSYSSTVDLFGSDYNLKIYNNPSKIDDMSTWGDKPAKLRNGMFINFNVENASCQHTSTNDGTLSGYICSQIHVDVNGRKGPNMYGKDYVGFWLARQDGVYKIYPMGIEGSKKCIHVLPGGVTENGDGCTVYYIQDKAQP
jgi:type II secretory pathway pseudopilin PulG